MAEKGYLENMVSEINEILKKHGAKSYDVPGSLLAYAMAFDQINLIDEFLEEGFVMLEHSNYIGWMKTPEDL